MAIRKELGLMFSAGALVLSTACPSLDVANPNDPNLRSALDSPDDVITLATSSVNRWYMASTDVDPWLMLMVTADNMTSNFGCAGMRFNNMQPRIPYENSSAGGDQWTARWPWQEFYGAMGAASDALRAMNDGVVIPSGTDRIRHVAMFTQALSLAQIAMMFDRAFIIDENTDLLGPLPDLSPYSEVAAAALGKLDALIAATGGADHTYDPSVLPMTVGPLNSQRLYRLANSMAAATLRYTPRRPNDPNWALGAPEWAKILAYAQKGIGHGDGTQGAPFDMEVIGDATSWWSYLAYYGAEQSWTRVDLRLINQAAPNIAAEFTSGMLSPTSQAHTVPRMVSDDARVHCTEEIETSGIWSCGDFRWHPTVLGDRGRGVYMMSPISYQRYIHHSRTSPTFAQTPVPWMLAAESDLLHAEAIINTGGSLADAATLINHTRVGRGGLTPATGGNTAQELLAMINYERHIELYASNGWDLFRHRVAGTLRTGTVCHLPIPAVELGVMGAPVYTFGGPGGGAGSPGCNATGPSSFVAGRIQSLLALPGASPAARPVALRTQF
jgi:starch-binding outer membrane protein, SusD/RagB family